jgi:uncharacterized caspase-like protein
MCVWCLAALLVGIFLIPSVGNAKPRVAIVFGNSAYQNVPALSNPKNDASDISQSLGRLGFVVQMVTDANFDEMRRRVIAFGREAQGSDIAVVYFAGHGMEIGGENWLIPVDAEATLTRRVRRSVSKLQCCKFLRQQDSD